MGDSNHSIFVFGPKTRAGCARSSSVMKRCATPNFDIRSSRMWNVPP